MVHARDIYPGVRGGSCGVERLCNYLFHNDPIIYLGVCKGLRKIQFLSDMAQTVFQVPGLRHDPEHADVQGFQQAAVLRGVSRTIPRFIS